MNNIENWKKHIFSLPEQVFFDVMRNYLGDVKTPFNKHDLVNKLSSFLIKDLTAEKVLSLIDRSDAEIITAIGILENPTVKELFTVFKDKKSYYDFYLNLLNLEERMLVFSEEIDGESRISISPVFKSLFMEKVISPELLFSSCDCPEKSGSQEGEVIWLNDSVLFSVFSFLLRQEAILKIDGSFRKKVIEELKEIFPDSLMENTDEKIELMRFVIRRLNLAINDGDFFKPDIDRWIELAKLSGRERIELLLGAAVSDDYTFYGSLAAAAAETLIMWNRGFSQESLRKVFKMIALKNRADIYSDNDFPDSFINAFVTLGILREDSGIYYPQNKVLYQNNPDKKSTLILQPNFDIITDTSIPFDAGVILSLAADVKRYSDMIHLSLSRESYIRALESGFSGKDVEAFFEKYTGHGLPQNVRFSLQSWEKEFRSIELFAGIVMTVSEKKRKIIDNSGQFDENLLRKLADGVYLVKPENLDKLKKALSMSGIDHLAAVEGDIVGSETARTFNADSFASDLEKIKHCRPLLKPVFGKDDYTSYSEININDFSDKIESLNFTAEQKKVIKERIERKIILFPSQITEGSARYEKNEAKGLDYNGKIRLAEQALESRGYLLEIVERKDDEQITSLVKPENLDKSGKDVLLEGILLPDEEKISIKIGKAGVVKKIKTSLFMK